MLPTCWPDWTERRRLPALLLVAGLALAGCQRSAPGVVAQASADAAPDTLLFGPAWLGIWQGGRLVNRVDAGTWVYSAVRLSADGQTVEVAAYPANAATGNTDAASATVLSYQRGTLELVTQTLDPQAGQWQPLPPPVGTDGTFAPVQAARPGAPLLEAGTALIAISATASLTAAPGAQGATLLQARSADGQPVGPARSVAGAQWRAAMSPDGSTVAAFTPGAQTDQPWSGMAWTARTGVTLTTPGLTIDDGSGRENGAARALACLLPGGAGAIFSYIGAPADRYSEFQPFGPEAGGATRLDAPWVLGCLALTAAIPAQAR